MYAYAPKIQATIKKGNSMLLWLSICVLGELGVMLSPDRAEPRRAKRVPHGTER